MARDPLYTWEGHEYVFEEHGPDWYWALGIITFAAVVTAVLFSNILLALVIVAGAAAIALQAAKHGRTHRFAIYENGIAVDTTLYLYEDMRDFAILEYVDPSLPPALSIKTNHILAPHLLIPIHGHDPEEIYFHIAEQLPEGSHEETPLDRFMAMLRI